MRRRHTEAPGRTSRPRDRRGRGWFLGGVPARAIGCAGEAVAAVRELGIEIRAGVHTGECEWVGGSLRRIAVHVGARSSAIAGAGQVIVWGLIRDLSAGSGTAFGEQELKDVPGRWPLYLATIRREGLPGCELPLVRGPRQSGATLFATRSEAEPMWPRPPSTPHGASGKVHLPDNPGPCLRGWTAKTGDSRRTCDVLVWSQGPCVG